MLDYMARGITVTDGMKVATKLILRYLGGPDVVTKVFIRDKRERIRGWWCDKDLF